MESLTQKLEVLVDAGKATPGPPLGPALGPLGVNIPEIVKAINERTKSFEGMKVPVTLFIDPRTKEYTIDVGTPPTSALILKEIGVEKGSGTTPNTYVGNLTLQQAIRIAEMKKDSLPCRNLRSRVLEVLGTCVSMGVTVEGKSPKEFTREVKEGRLDSKLARP